MDIKEAPDKNVVIARHPWELARVEILMKFINESIKNTDQSRISIIDIGCGDLFVIEKISENFKFNQYYGVDIALSNEDITQLENKYQSNNIKVLNDISKVSVPNENMSIILLNDVIEHIKDDKQFLLELQKNKFINEKSVIIITVPAYQFLFCSHDTFLDHYRRYSNSHLIKLLNSTNFTVNSKGYFFSLLLIPRFIQVIKEKFIKSKKQKEITGTGLTTWNMNKPISLLIKNILLMDYFISSFFLKLKIKIPGLSTFVVCKKSV